MRPMPRTTKHCETKNSAPVGLSLPVLALDPSDGGLVKGSRAPKSTMGRRRAAVLIVIQLLMVVHVVQWLWTGTTIKPIEPSESMETVKDGVITVGAIFFGLALLSTAILGRWFCGWGCHVVMLQDFCGYLMKRIGIRPRLFRSRLLLWLPLSLACYMFLWPVVYRFAIAPYTRPGLEWPGFSTSLVTSDFWATFPGVVMSIPFLLVCGFLTVYLLGAKGYCTYGCPYGGFFAPLDELSPLRIRVTDACTQCGHCTAVCTSNVRVHEEVRDFRMVVDQGCMKCMDCVSACPEQALHVGWGKPAFLAKPVFERTPRKWDLSWNEELALAAVAVLAFFAVRGAIGVPLLFASGIAICAAALAWQCAQLVYGRDVRLHKSILKREGRVTKSGFALGFVVVVLLGALAAVGSVNALLALADFEQERVAVSPQVVYNGSGSKALPETRARAAAGLAHYQNALSWAATLGLDGPIRSGAEARMAWLDAVQGDFPQAEARLRACAAREGMNEALALTIARVVRGGGDAGGGVAFARKQWEANPSWGGLREELINMLLADEEFATAEMIARRAVEIAPNDYVALRRLGAMLVESNRFDLVPEGLSIIDRLLVADPNNALLMLARAVGYQRLERFDDAEKELLRAIEIDPRNWLLHQALADLLMSIDRQKEAMPIMKRAGDLRVKALQQ